MATIDRFRCSDEDHARLIQIRDSGPSDRDTFAPLMRLFIKMGLLLHDHGIHTLEDLEARLKTLSSKEACEIEDRIINRLTPIIEASIERALDRRLHPKNRRSKNRDSRSKNREKK